MANDVDKAPTPTMEQRAAEKIAELEASIANMQQAVQAYTQKAEEARIQVIAQMGALQVLKEVAADGDAITMGELGALTGGGVEYVPSEKKKDKPAQPAKG